MNTHQQTQTMKHPLASHDIFTVYLGSVGLGLAVLSGIALALAGLGTRFDWWYFRTGFVILKWAGIAGAVAALISLVGGLLAHPSEHRAAFLAALAGIVIGLGVAAVPLYWMNVGQKVPKIHDITTDTANPPQFIAVLALRENAENSAVYGGPAVAAQQHAAYPDIKPIILPVPQATAFKYALATARRMEWRIHGMNAREGRIEATATTFWFGFKDDIVVRIRPVPGGSRVDVRSVSRVGLSDMGMNAKRIRTFLHSLTGTSIIDPNWNG